MYSSPTLINCTISANASGRGGGIHNWFYSCPELIGCTISGNTSEPLWFGGGGMYCCQDSSPILTNCTISGNMTIEHGGGIYCREESRPTIVNCILWDNAPEQIYTSGETPLVTYSDVQAGHAGQGNIDADPLFADAANDDYHLLPGSPAIDAGDPLSDYSSEPWPNGGRVNMGAYGNTTEATRPPANFDDLALLCDYWLQYERSLDIAPVPVGDGVINFLDFGVLAAWWLGE